MARTFSYINDKRIEELISSAKRYAIYAAPSISKSTAQALVCCGQQSGLKTHIVLDVDAKPMRLGFGDPEGLPYLFEHGVEIRKAAGLRVGVIVIDDEAWVYAPTPEIILKQPDETLSNAVKVNTDFALEMIPAVAPEIAKELNILDATIIRENEEKPREAEIGQTIAQEEDVKAVERSISENPPVKFDYERQLRVYKSLFQFVGFHFIGGKITSHTITIPPVLLNIAEEDSDLRNRIRSTCRLVDESNPFARKFKEFGSKIHKLRKDYTCPLGERYGSIILRKIRPEFDEKVEKARTEMKALTAN